jgi:catechol 2,3-dioxygenase-like lactoylglutathione lyase family enzyme
MKIERLDHLVLTVRNVEDACHFYSTVLGMEIVFFESGHRALTVGDQRINLHEAGSEMKPHAQNPTVGSADLCFISDTPLPAVMEHLRPFGVKIVEGPVEHTGAAGKIRSIYFRDPDNNLIEVGEYAEQKSAATDKKSSALVPPPPLPPEAALSAPDIGMRFTPLPPPPTLKPEVSVPVGAGGAKQFTPLPPPPPLKKS